MEAHGDRATCQPLVDALGGVGLELAMDPIPTHGNHLLAFCR